MFYLFQLSIIIKYVHIDAVEGEHEAAFLQHLINFHRLIVRQKIAARAPYFDRFPGAGSPRDLADCAGKDPRMTPQDGFFAAFFQDDGVQGSLAGFRIEIEADCV